MSAPPSTSNFWILLDFHEIRRGGHAIQDNLDAVILIP